MITLREAMDAAEKVNPIETRRGVDVVTFEEQRNLAVVENYEGGTINNVQYNEDGTVARTPGRNVATNPASYYINRVKIVDDSLYVVRDYRAITEQSSGKVHLSQIPAYVLKRDDKKKLRLEKIVTISDNEFLADFTDRLNNEAMAEVLPLLAVGVETTAIPMPI